MAGAGRAGEQQAVDARARRRAPCPASGPPISSRTTPSGISASWKQSDQELADRGRLLRRLEHHRVAGDQRRDDVAVGQVRGEIIRARARRARHAACGGPRSVAERRFELPLRRALGIGVDRDLDLVDDRADLGPRFPERLAGLARDQLGELGFLACARHWRSGAAPRSDRRANARPRPARRRARRRLRPRHRRSRPTRAPRRSPARSRRACRPRPRASTTSRLFVKLPVHPAPSLRPSGGPL